MKNILIINVPGEISLHAGKNMPPLGIALLKGYLEDNGHKVDLYDTTDNYLNIIKGALKEHLISHFDKTIVKDYLNNEKINTNNLKVIECLLENVAIESYDLVGISCGSGQSFFEIHMAFILGKYIQSKLNKTVVFGGANITYLHLFKGNFKELWDLLLEHFSFFFKGPSEIPFNNLLKNLDNENVIDYYKTLSGAIYKQNGEIASNAESLPSFSCPDFKGLDLTNYATYLNKNNPNEIEVHYKWPYPLGIKLSQINKKVLPKEDLSQSLFLPYVFNFYCPYKCTFCEQSNELKKQPCSKSVDAVINELKNLTKTYNCRNFIFFNNAVNFNKKFISEFCDGIIKENLNILWGDCARANGLTKEIVEHMYKAGCRRLIFGLETGSEKLLKYINKKLNIDQLSNALEWCKQIGIYAEVEIIVGFPFEYEEDFMDTYNFIMRNLKNLNFFYPNRYFVIPSSLLGKYPEKYGIKVSNNLSYADLLKRSADFVKSNFITQDEKDNGIFNFHILKYEEINGRDWGAIYKSSAKYYNKLIQLQRSLPVFKEVNQLLRNPKSLQQ